MVGFFDLIWNFYTGIFNIFNSTIIRYGNSPDDTVSLGSILFSAIVIGFVVSLFWKGAKAQ